MDKIIGLNFKDLKEIDTKNSNKSNKIVNPVENFYKRNEKNIILFVDYLDFN